VRPPTSGTHSGRLLKRKGRSWPPTPPARPGRLRADCFALAQVRDRLVRMAHDVLLGERQRAHPHPSALQTALPMAAAWDPAPSPDAESRVSVPRQQLHVNRRYLGEPQNRICLPGIAGHTVPVEAHLFFSVQLVAWTRRLDLVRGTVRVDHQAGVDRDGQPPDPDLADRLHVGDTAQYALVFL